MSGDVHYSASGDRGENVRSFGPEGRPLFIVVEGPNGAGKTTTVTALASVLGMTPLGYPPPFLRFREAVRLDRDIGAEARLLYYLAAIRQLGDAVEATPLPVVCDRYCASPLAAVEAEAALAPDVVDRISEPVLDRIPHPDLTILLRAEPAALADRIRGRAEARSSASAAGVLTSPGFADRWTDRLQVRASRYGPLVEIDTTNLSVAEMVDAAVGEVQSAQANPAETVDLLGTG